MKPAALLLLAALLALGFLAARGTADRQAAEPSFAPPADLPRGGLELLEAVPFVLDEPFVHEWRAEKPLARAGFLLALRADADLARTRETFEPVLYVGDQTAERCHPVTDDTLVVLVPAPLGADGRVALELDSTPIWFGTLELPERVDAARIAHERALAEARGLGPAARGPRVRFTADQAVRARTRWELEPYLEDLIARHVRR
ncbi:MAG TPA: hypothetical protein VF530_13950 [Planctomycetota bacterium]